MSIRKRVDAWRLRWQLPEVPGVFFLLEAVQVRVKEDLALLAARLDERDIKPILIVIDTLARCFAGGDENSAKDMGEFVEGLEWLKRHTGATVVLLHHTGKVKNNNNAATVERGSSALRAAVDTMIRVSKKATGLVVVHNDKQKDHEHFKDIALRLQQVPISGEHGNTTTSCILVTPGSAQTAEQFLLPEHLRPTLQALASQPGGHATRKQWAIAANLAERTLDSHRQNLVASGCVDEIGRGKYRISDKGRIAAATAATAMELQPAADPYLPLFPAATATPPVGVADAAEATENESERYYEALKTSEEMNQ